MKRAPSKIKFLVERNLISEGAPFMILRLCLPLDFWK